MHNKKSLLNKSVFPKELQEGSLQANEISSIKNGMFLVYLEK